MAMLLVRRFAMTVLIGRFRWLYFLRNRRSEWRCFIRRWLRRTQLSRFVIKDVAILAIKTNAHPTMANRCANRVI